MRSASCGSMVAPSLVTWMWLLFSVIITKLLPYLMALSSKIAKICSKSAFTREALMVLAGNLQERVKFWLCRRDSKDFTIVSSSFLTSTSSRAPERSSSSARDKVSSCWSNFFRLWISRLILSIQWLSWMSAASRLASIAASGVLISWLALAIKIFWEV